VVIAPGRGVIHRLKFEIGFNRRWTQMNADCRTPEKESASIGVHLRLNQGQRGVTKR
jgi:hypothetical protein